jgi:hypothetical protein
MLIDEIPKLQAGESLNLELTQILQEFADGDPEKVESAMASLQELADKNGCVLNRAEMRDIYITKGPTAELNRT